jgi:hypothetical protein
MAGNKYITPDVFVLSRTEDTNSNSYSTGQGIFKACWNHLKYLETLGITTELARNHGNAVNGRGPGTGWWDEATRFGNNGWSLFRWNSNTNRTWDWYMFIQNCDTGGPSSPGTPGRTATSLGNSRGFAIAGAISISGSVTSNPWGGTTGSMGSDTKGDPVWTTGSVGDKLFVFPDSNGVSGSHSTQRHNLAGDYGNLGNSDSARVHFISDNDTFVWMRQRLESVTSCGFGYLGLYEPFTRLNANGVEDTETPNFIGYTRWNNTSPWASSQDSGGLAGTNTNSQGACILPHENDSQMRAIRMISIGEITDLSNLQRRGGVLVPLFDANFTINSALPQQYKGIMGRFDPSMFQVTIDTPPFVRITNTSPTKTVWTVNDDDSNLMTGYVTPWHPDAPIFERKDRFGERRRFVVTSST